MPLGGTSGASLYTSRSKPEERGHDLRDFLPLFKGEIMDIGPSENGKMRKDFREEFFWTLEYWASKIRRSSVWRCAMVKIGRKYRTGASLDL